MIRCICFANIFAFTRTFNYLCKRKSHNPKTLSNEEYIRLHREDDVRRLALTRAPEGVDHKWCLQQIEGWQLARKKMPQWAATDGLWYPVRLSMEQCSSEATAQYKRQLVERLIPEGQRHTMADLTGGLGVDFSYMAPLFDEATYVEILPELLRLAEHNMPLLGIKQEKLRIENGDSSDNLQSSIFNVQLIFLDPARRDTAGRKTVGIADCTPNLLEMQDELLAHAQWVMVKLSPMLDITDALRQLKGVREVHVVSVQGECKELLFVMQASPYPLPRRGHEPCSGKDGVTIHCVNLGTDEDIVKMGYEDNEKMRKSSSLSHSLNLSISQFLYEPNASILKAGIQDILCERYGVWKLHPMSNLFVGDTLIPRFPGRRFRIVGMSDFSKKGLKALVGDLHQANLTIRNFPTPVAQLRRQLRLSEGGDVYLFATTINDGQHVLIRCERA